MVIRKTADLRIKKAELWGVNSGEQEASKLTSMSPLTFTGTRKDDMMVAWSVKSPRWRQPSDVALKDRS